MADKNSQIRTLKTAYRTSNIRLIMKRVTGPGFRMQPMRTCAREDADENRKADIL